MGNTSSKGRVTCSCSRVAVVIASDPFANNLQFASVIYLYLLSDEDKTGNENETYPEPLLEVGKSRLWRVIDLEVAHPMKESEGNDALLAWWGKLPCGFDRL